MVKVIVAVLTAHERPRAGRRSHPGGTKPDQAARALQSGESARCCWLAGITGALAGPRDTVADYIVAEGRYRFLRSLYAIARMVFDGVSALASDLHEVARRRLEDGDQKTARPTGMSAASITCSTPACMCGRPDPARARRQCDPDRAHGIEHLR